MSCKEFSCKSNPWITHDTAKYCRSCSIKLGLEVEEISVVFEKKKTVKKKSKSAVVRFVSAIDQRERQLNQSISFDMDKYIDECRKSEQRQRKIV